MKISVIICAYNALATIEATIDSVLGQTHPADEILIMDDGSTDGTFARLTNYGSRIRTLRQSNQGLSAARNALCREATGDVLAFLDADDVWHRDYLKIQHEMLIRQPNAAASFTGFVDSNQYQVSAWGSPDSVDRSTAEVIDAVNFFKRYNRSTVQFPPSAWCVKKNIFDQMGDEPFPVKFPQIGKLTGGEDFWFMNILVLFGRPVVYHPLPRVMYRLTSGSLSTDRIKMMQLNVNLCELLALRYQVEAGPDLLRSMREVFPSIRRNFSKFLMGAGRFSEARIQMKASIKEAGSLKSIVKSLGLLFVSHLPFRLQPKWPSQFRQHD